MWDTLVLNMPPLPNEASVEFQVNFKTWIYYTVLS